MKKTFICPRCNKKFEEAIKNIIVCPKCKFIFSLNVVPNNNIKEAKDK